MAETKSSLDTATGDYLGLFVPTDIEGGKITVGTTPVELTFDEPTLSIYIQSDSDNAGIIYFGKSNVASDGSNAMGRIDVGGMMGFSFDGNATSIFVVASQVGQVVYKMGLK